MDALKAKSADLKRIYLAGTGNESHFWSPRWTTSRVQGLPSIGVSGREPGRLLKRLWSPAEGSRPYARTIVLTSATLSTPGFKESSMWRSIEIATGADPSSGLMLTDLATTIEPYQFGRLRVRFADPRAPVPRFDDDGNIASDALEYSIAVITAAMECSARDKGRTLVLVPSYADADSLRARLLAATLRDWRASCFVNHLKSEAVRKQCVSRLSASHPGLHGAVFFLFSNSLRLLKREGARISLKPQMRQGSR